MIKKTLIVIFVLYIASGWASDLFRYGSVFIDRVALIGLGAFLGMACKEETE